jgi:type 1 glutamine amidotransferase
MLNRMNRRDFLKTSALAAGASVVLPYFLASPVRAEETTAKKKVLFFTKSSGFQHSVITRDPNDDKKLAYAEQILTDLGAQHGFDVTCSKDGNVFAPGSIEHFDLYFFYTTGDLTKDSDKYEMKKGPDGKKNIEDKDKRLHREPGMPPGAKEAFLKAIEDGKGFVGFHCATDTFHSPRHVKGKVDLLRDVNEKGEDEFDPYIKMIGGEFIIHGKQQDATLKAIDPNFPGAKAFDNARFTEEWYSLKNFSPDLRVILAQDCTGMEGKMYERPMYPETWARMHGKGRVFYTSMGHREDVWKKPEFLDLVVNAMRWTTGQVDADVTPNLKHATPEAEPTAAAK